MKRYIGKKGPHLHLNAETGLDSLNIVSHSSKVLFIVYSVLYFILNYFVIAFIFYRILFKLYFNLCYLNHSAF